MTDRQPDSSTPARLADGWVPGALLIRYLNEESLGITPGRSVSTTVSALVLGKIHLLLDERHFTNLFTGKPLILPTVWKTPIFSLSGSLALMFEETVPITFRLGSPVLAFERYAADLVWPRFWTNHLFMIVSILLFSSTSELIRAIGASQVLKWFFGRRKKPPGLARAMDDGD